MIRLAAALMSLAAVAAGVAAADGPSPSATTNSLFASGGRMFTTAAHSHQTVVSLWRIGHKARRVTVPGSFGFPTPTFDGTGEGLSHDGRTLVLAAPGASRYVVLDARSLAVRRTVQLQGQFSYDALSPTGRTLFLIQHATPTSNRYYVRAYDLAQGRLLQQVVFDTREKSSLMSGSPVTRATGPSGRWIYTLYVRPSGAFFVHALDSVDRHAVCVDLPRKVAPVAVWHTKLEWKPGRLAVVAGTKRLAVIDTKTLRLTAR
jgi:hypothetical protein